MKTYHLVVMLEDFKQFEITKTFENENEMINFITNYLNGNLNYVVDVYENNKKIHCFEYCLGSRNEMHLYDMLLN